MKMLLKDAGSSILCSSGILKLCRFNTRIIAYHTVNPSYFEKQMAYLKKNYMVSSLDEALKNPDRQQVVITFDDGYRNNLVYAYPVLKKMGFKATLYVTFNFIDDNLFAWWDRLEYSGKNLDPANLKLLPPEQIEETVFKETGLSQTSDKPEQYDFASWDELKKASDVFDIGSHTVSHAILTNLTERKAVDEIVESKRIIENKIKRKITSFAYPNGNANASIADSVKQAGYINAVTYLKGNNNKHTDKFMLFRRGINKIDSPAVFAAKVAGVF